VFASFSGFDEFEHFPKCHALIEGSLINPVEFIIHQSIINTSLTHVSYIYTGVASLTFGKFIHTCLTSGHSIATI